MIKVSLFTRNVLKIIPVYSPRFLDWFTLITSILSDEPIHTSVKQAIDELMFGQKSLDTCLLPIPAISRPFYKDSGTNRYSMFSDYDK